jgi:Zn finger protein HypA/HybF involved in hydrogenase expression
MKEKKSIYECPVCKLEIKSLPAEKLYCPKCQVEMKEIQKGIITK